MSSMTEHDFASQSTAKNEDDIFTILVATDIHLGFAENDPIRDMDTFDTFEEILQIASAEEVDFILLGGDLFHHSRPSPYCIYKCTELLRRYCLGDKPVEIEFLSDPSHNFRSIFNTSVNYEDPNLNVSIPVFSIHGNHDDPTGQKQISAMDLMATSGLINYFGRYTNYDLIEIDPILLKKGQTKLALYGLSHINDERLGRLFLDKKVKFMSPSDPDNWFHLLVWHQNRAARGVKNFIPDDCLPDLLDFVIWGHEHDCRIKPERMFNDVLVSQPGSSVATSLAAGEAIPKKVGILKIHKKHFQMTPVELKTVRPFIFEELVLKNLDEMMNEDNNGLTASEISMDIVTKKVNSMIVEAKKLGRTGRASEIPLIRLNVKYDHERQVFNSIRFGQSYFGQVANHEDMVKCQAIKQPVKKDKGTGDIQIDDTAAVHAVRVEDIVSKYFEENDVLKCFPVYCITEAVKKYIDADDVEAPGLAINILTKETVKHLEEHMPEFEELDDVILKFKHRDLNILTSLQLDRLLNDPGRQKKPNTSNEFGTTRANGSSDDRVEIDDDDDAGDDNDSSRDRTNFFNIKPTRGKGSRGGKGSTRKPRRAGRGRSK